MATVSGEASSRSVCPVGRRVDDHAVVLTGTRQADNLDQPHELVDSRNRQAQERIDVLPIEPRAVLDDVAERQAVGAQPSGERPAGVDFRRVQRPAARGTREAHLPRARRQAHAQHVAE